MTDKIKQCGNCEFWDNDRACWSSIAHNKIASCTFPTPSSVPKTMTYDNHGYDCPVYKERNNGK